MRLTIMLWNVLGYKVIYGFVFIICIEFRTVHNIIANKINLKIMKLSWIIQI